MKRMIATSLLTLMVFGMSFAASGGIEFRLVVDKKDIASIPSDKLTYIPRGEKKQQEIFLSKEAFLRNADIKEIKIVSPKNSLNGHSAFDIIFNRAGQKKLKDVTSLNIRKKMAILANNEILMTPYILMPIKSGHVYVQADALDTDKKVKDFVKELGF
ncbi:MAG: hypothetical protein ABIJ41_01370 [Candidatus Omnitrophota bacterium]